MLTISEFISRHGNNVEGMKVRIKENDEDYRHPDIWSVYKTLSQDAILIKRIHEDGSLGESNVNLPRNYKIEEYIKKFTLDENLSDILTEVYNIP